MTKIGLDLGSSSLGWAIRNEDEISKKGVITFSSGMVKGQGGYSSPTRDRREARSKRNLIRARKYRKWELLNILCEDKKFVPLDIEELDVWRSYKKGRTKKFPENPEFLKWLACDFAYEGGLKYKNPYELRVKALDEKLTDHEFGRALYHLVQRRGYKDIGETDTETETQIKRRSESGFQNSLDKHRTIGEALSKEFLDKGKRARNEYPYREEYQNELETICEAQGYDVSKKGKSDYADDFISRLWKAIIWQRPLRSQKGKIGKCTLEPSKQRIPLSHPLFEISRAWQFINTIKYCDKAGKKQFLPQSLRNSLYNDLFLKKSDSFKFEDIRKFVDKKLNAKVKFNYPLSEKSKKYETKIPGMPFCYGIIKIFGAEAGKALNEVENFNIGDANKLSKGYSVLDLWHALFDFDEDYLGDFAVTKLGIADVTVKRNKKEVLLSPLVIFKRKMPVGYGDLSIKALKKIIPFLKEGYLYNEAVVLAKVPDILKGEWEQKKDEILRLLKESRDAYNWKKQIVGVTNNLIDKYKGAIEEWRSGGPPVIAWKNTSYVLDESDDKDIEEACIGYFGEQTWLVMEKKDDILSEIGKEYQDFYFQSKRSYREVPPLTDLFKRALEENGIVLHGELYHHSKRKNIYGAASFDKKTGMDILPIPLIDSIKNPMFNKSMSILRRLVNELILQGDIDSDTEVVVEVARELNDNNKRAAIERYQNERRTKREEIKKFLEEFKRSEGRAFDVNERIRDFELWSEQIFENTTDNTGQKAKEILREKDAVKRYSLWMEQKGQCMYTGKMISISQLFSNEIDIEHTIPRWLLPDNTLANATVCFAKYNRDEKGKLMPFYCKNYNRDVEGLGSAIKPRLANWEKTRDSYKGLYESRLKPSGNEDEIKKNKRIQEKHYFKMHFDYWKDKIERFTTDEIKDKWARRQLVDTQMVSKYAREFLKTYFKKVAVQKGSVTADFRKIYGFQEADEIKSRNKHTHHAIDAAVLTLIPVNSSMRDSLLKKMYKKAEEENRQFTIKPYPTFNSQKLIDKIEKETLIVNYQKDKILQQTFRKVRKRGKIQYVKDRDENFVLDPNGQKIVEMSRGDTVRSTLFAQTYLGKIRDVEKDSDGKPIRLNGDWKYKTGEDEFVFTERKPLKDVISKTQNIIDPEIRKIVDNQKSDAKDQQGNKIRHVRIKVRAGQVVKGRVNYRSKHEHKNFYYSAAGSIPYGILLEKIDGTEIERELIPVASFEIAKVFGKYKKFSPELYMAMFHERVKRDSNNCKLLKVGQKVLILKTDSEYNKRKNLDFQRDRLYRITQFENDGKRIMFQHHMEAQSMSQVRSEINEQKHEIISKLEKELDLPELKEDASIPDVLERKKEFDKRRFNFNKRVEGIEKSFGQQTGKKISDELKKHQTEYSTIPDDIIPSYLKISKSNWLFLYEGYNFEMTATGLVRWID